MGSGGGGGGGGGGRRGAVDRGDVDILLGGDAAGPRLPHDGRPGRLADTTLLAPPSAGRGAATADRSPGWPEPLEAGLPVPHEAD